MDYSDLFADTRSRSPEERLNLAVVGQALEELVSADPTLRREAYAYVFSRTREDETSFGARCAIAKLKASYVRRLASRMLATTTIREARV